MRRLNGRIAERLREAADLLQQQNANASRTAAYRRAADTLVARDENVASLLARGGIEGLTQLPGVGQALAAAIAEMVHTGRWRQLERLRGEVNPEALFHAMPGIGPALARRIHLELGVDTLEELEVAANDGRLEAVPGVGPRRAAMLRAALVSMLARTTPVRQSPRSEPDIAVLLDVDREYRDKAGRGLLATIAPRRFNPQGEARLPVLHTERGPWHFTALFSNTARAHALGRTRDWVMVYFHTDSEPEGQRTIVTETRGSLRGRRVVRGREAECQRCYASPVP